MTTNNRTPISFPSSTHITPAPSPSRGVSVTLGGTDYTLRYRLGDIRQLETLLGKQLFDGSLFANMTVANLIIMVYQGLRHLGDSAPTMDRLEDELDLDDIPAMVEGIKALVQRAFPNATPTTPATASTQVGQVGQVEGSVDPNLAPLPSPTAV